MGTDGGMDASSIDAALDGSRPDARVPDARLIDADPIDVGTADAPALAPLGTSCADGTECASGSCVDAVCCDTACDGLCVACTAALTGGVDGTCAPSEAATDPDDECDVTDASTCGSTGSCDGAGACTLHPLDTVCAAPSCTADVETHARTCDGLGVCTDRGTESCAPLACRPSGVCASNCAIDGDCVADHYCAVASGTCTPTQADGTACTTDSQCASGACADGVCCDGACDGACEACTAVRTGALDGTCAPATAGTDPDGECTDAGAMTCTTDGVCDGAGACRLYAAGTTCAPASCTAGTASRLDSCDGAGRCIDGGTAACAPYVCGMTTCLPSCAADGDCATGHFCASGVCTPARANGARCAAPNQCASAFCIDGVCCDSACDGTCEACTGALRGAGFDGECGAINAGLDPDANCAAQPQSSCSTTGTCDGARACALWATGTVCVAASCGAGTASAADTCDGAGACVDGGTSACTPYVCGVTACRANCAGDGDCTATHYCSGGACVPRAANGATCSVSNMCSSGFCVDGVCCNAACTGECSACTAALRGSGTDGTCGAIAASTDPDNECAATPASGCDNDGMCNGAGACRVWASGTVCAAASCAASVQSNPDTCDGAGTCVDGGTTACTPYVCGAAACRTSCGGDADCTSTNYCLAGACVLRQVNGATCSTSSQCSSGFCVDGVCCNAACAGTCSACTAARRGSGTDGTCGTISLGTDPDNECAANPASSCDTSGACNGAGGCSLWPSGTVCAAGSCSAASQLNPDTCNGSGTCVDGGSVNCSPYMCDGAVCGTSCTGDADCRPAYFCSAASCVPRLTNGNACSAANQCSSGNCVDGVCCNSACTGTCSACTAALRGGGTDGTCGLIASGTDPDNECATSSASSCGTDGTCNGSGACRLWANGTVCAAGSCTSGVQSNPDTCNGGGTCVDRGTVACTPYVCGPSACGTNCGGDSDCTASNYCSGGACVARKANGTVCLGGNECTSGNCVDGVCCNTACTGSCSACSAALRGSGTDGTCGTISAGTDPESECAASSASSCGTDGTCNGAGACRLWASGTVCAAGSCSSGTQSNPDTCNGTGTCVDAGTVACTPYVCGPSACQTSCATDPQCVSGNYCNGASTCVPWVCTPNAASCSGGNVVTCDSRGSGTTLTTTCSALLGCSAGACVVGCGDGILQAGEECDDANVVDTDVCTNACQHNYAAIVRADGAIAYWDFEETAGPTVLDVIGGRVGTLSGTAIQNVPGLFSQSPNAVSFTAAGYFGMLPDPALDPSSYSVEVWLRPDDCSTSVYVMRNGNGFNGWEFWINLGQIAWSNASSSPFTWATVPTSCVVGRVEHLVGVSEPGVVRLYNNGILVGSTAATAITSTGRLSLGDRTDSFSTPYRGTMDDLSFYPRALTPAEIALHYAAR